MTLDEDITLVDMTDGCCPEKSVPGAKHYTQYKGAQVVCGFKEDGTVAVTTGSSNGAKTCTYNSCYVDKQNLPCADDSKQLLNGCCKKTTGNNVGFPTSCMNYYYNFNNVWGEKVQYCLTYHKDYGTKGPSGTLVTTDDQDENKLITSKVYTYTPCDGGDSGGDSGASAPGAGTASGSTMPTAFAGFMTAVIAMSF